MGIILFGDKAQKEEIKNLKIQVRNLEKDNARLEDKDADNETRVAKMRTDFRISQDQMAREHRIEVQGLKTEHAIAIDDLEADVEKLEKSFDARVDKEVSGIKKDLKNKEKDLDKKDEAREKAHTERMKRLEADYAAKIAKTDRELESDKASYRKYLRSELNSKIEKLEKDNDRLFKENVSLNSTNEGNQEVIGNLKGQVNVMEEVVKGLTKTVDGLSSKIGEGLVKALPQIEASFETPNIPENHVHVEIPGAAKGGQGGGKQEGKN